MCAYHFRENEKIVWDLTTLDKLLYLVNSITFLTCAILLLVFIKPLPQPHKSIDCVFPEQFSNAWMLYGKKVCLSDKAGLRKIPENLTAPDFSGDLTLYQQVCIIFYIKCRLVVHAFSNCILLYLNPSTASFWKLRKCIAKCW